MSENNLKDVYKRFEETFIRSGRQSGRSQLSKDLNYLFTRAETAYFLQEQNKRYREALEFYASDETWKIDETNYSDADKYKGKVACEALEESK